MHCLNPSPHNLMKIYSPFMGHHLTLSKLDLKKNKDIKKIQIIEIALKNKSFKTNEHLYQGFSK